LLTLFPGEEGGKGKKKKRPFCKSPIPQKERKEEKEKGEGERMGGRSGSSQGVLIEG